MGFVLHHLRRLAGIVLILAALCVLWAAMAPAGEPGSPFLRVVLGVFGVALFVAGSYVLDPSFFSKPGTIDFVPGNDLEKRLLAACRNESEQPVFEQTLVQSELLGLATEEEPRSPMTFSAHFDASLVPNGGANAGDVGPFVWGFTSERRVRQLRTQTTIGGVVPPGTFHPFPVKQLLQLAAERGATFVVNPFLACCWTCGPDHAAELLERADKRQAQNPTKHDEHER